MDAGMRARARRIDAHDARMRHRRSEEFAVHHARKHDVVRKRRLSGYLCATVDAAPRFSNQIHDERPGPKDPA
jgi:hypothetical protein